MTTLEATCAAHGLPWNPAWASVLENLAALVADAQTRTNLVGDASPAGVSAHVIEALTVAAATQQALGRAPRRVVDIGAGAGLEALTLAIVWPDAQVVAVEPRKLRAAFIAETAQRLGLRGVDVIAKSLFSANLKPVHELATARAVWPWPEWPEKGRSVLTPAGVVALHTHGPAATVAERIQHPAWTLAAALDVPGPKAYAVAMMRPA